MKKAFPFLIIVLSLFAASFLSLPKAENTNLAPLDSFGTYAGGYGHYGSGVQISGVTSAVQHNEHNSIYIGSHSSADPNTYREIDGPWIDVKPYDVIYLSIWIKTDQYDNTNDYGARLGVDFYSFDGNNYHAVDGLPSSGSYSTFNYFSMTPFNPSVSIWTSKTGTARGTNVMFIPWGSDWTQETYTFAIPDYFYTENMDGNSIPASKIAAIVPWLDARPYNTSESKAYFSDSLLHINPTVSPTKTQIPTPTLQPTLIPSHLP